MDVAPDGDEDEGIEEEEEECFGMCIYIFYILVHDEIFPLSPVCLCASPVAAAWQNSEEILPWGLILTCFGVVPLERNQMGKSSWNVRRNALWLVWMNLFQMMQFCITVLLLYLINQPICSPAHAGSLRSLFAFLILHSSLKIPGVWYLSFHWNCPNSNPWASQTMTRLLFVETELYLFKI